MQLWGPTTHTATKCTGVRFGHAGRETPPAGNTGPTPSTLFQSSSQGTSRTEPLREMLQRWYSLEALREHSKAQGKRHRIYPKMRGRVEERGQGTSALSAGPLPHTWQGSGKA